MDLYGLWGECKIDHFPCYNFNKIHNVANFCSNECSLIYTLGGQTRRCGPLFNDANFF